MKDYHAKLPPKKRSLMLECFVEDLLVSSKVPSSPSAIKRCKVNHKTAERYYRYFREVIHDHQKRLARFAGTIEIDHSTFGGRRRKRYQMIDDRPVPIPEKKVSVLGILQRGPDSQSHKVFVQIVSRLDKRTTIPIVRHVVESGSSVYTDMHRCFTDLGHDYTHKRVNHRRKEFGRREGEEKISTGTIDQFWRFCERRLSRFSGLADSTIHLHIQECAFRYNNKKDLEGAMRRVLQEYENPKRKDSPSLRSRRTVRQKLARTRRKVRTGNPGKARGTPSAQ